MFARSRGHKDAGYNSISSRVPLNNWNALAGDPQSARDRTPTRLGFFRRYETLAHTRTYEREQAAALLSGE